MGSAGGNADSDPSSDYINAILREFLGYELTESDFDCMLSSPDDAEVGDNFSMFDHRIGMADSEINLCRDLQSLNLNVPNNQYMEDNLINGDAQHYFNPPSPSPFDGLALETTNLKVNICPATPSVAKNAPFDPSMEDLGKQCSFKLEETGAGKTESSELKRKGVDLFGEALAKGNELIDAKDTTEEALYLDDPQDKWKIKTSTSASEFEPRRKSCYKNKGISLRLSRIKSGN